MVTAGYDFTSTKGVVQGSSRTDYTLGRFQDSHGKLINAVITPAALQHGEHAQGTETVVFELNRIC